MSELGSHIYVSLSNLSAANHRPKPERWNKNFTHTCQSKGTELTHHVKLSRFIAVKASDCSLSGNSSEDTLFFETKLRNHVKARKMPVYLPLLNCWDGGFNN